MPAKKPNPTPEIPKPVEMLQAFNEEKRREYVVALRESLIKAIRENAPFRKEATMQFTEDLMEKDTLTPELQQMVEEFRAAGYVTTVERKQGDYHRNVFVVVKWDGAK